MIQLYDLARVTTPTTGTGQITLGSAVEPWLDFTDAGVQDGDIVSYAIFDPPNSECGRGTYAASGGTLDRTTILSSTNSNAAIDLSGNAQVFITALAEDIGQPVWDAKGVTANNDGTFPTVAMRLNATSLVLFNPTTGGTKRLVPADMTQNLICAINANAAGSRDQSSAYTDSQDVWWYWIWGIGPGLNTINSVTAPGAGGPTLPSGYTHFCPAFLTKVWVQGGTPTIQPANPNSGATQLRVVDNWVYYSVPALLYPNAGIHVYPGASFNGYSTGAGDLSHWLPALSKVHNILLNPELHATAAAQVIAGCVASTAGNNIANMSLYPAPSSWDHNDLVLVYPLLNRQLTLTFLVTSGSPDISIADIFVNGYSF